MKNWLYYSNNRAVIDEDGNVRQVTNYYPFGGVFSSTAYNSGDDLQPYKYNGKELDRTHGLDWYDYGARNYDAIVPMFTSIDPLCEKYYHISPYVYCANNPMRFIDPDGRELDDYYFSSEGKQVRCVINNQPDRFFVRNSENKKYSEIKLNGEIGTLARIIYAEAVGENIKSKECVGDVMKNRVESPIYPNTYKEVAEQKVTKTNKETGKKYDVYQFSSVNPKDKSNWRYNNPTSTNNRQEKTKFAESISAAIKTINACESPTNGATLYYSPKSMPVKRPRPGWNFKILTEVSPLGVSKNSFRFFKLK